MDVAILAGRGRVKMSAASEPRNKKFFVAPDERVYYGRPVGVTIGPDRSLLVADDVGDVIWRVTAARQG
jgi:glucose/arabinose dehydrogenase